MTRGGFKKAKGKLPGFSIVELLVAIQIALLTMFLVSEMLNLVLLNTRRMVSESHSHGMSSAIASQLEDDITSAATATQQSDAWAVWGGLTGLRLVKMGKDFDGDGNHDLVCYQFVAPVHNTNPALVVQGHLLRGQFSGAAVIPKGGAGLTAGCTLATTDPRYYRVTTPDANLASIEFSYCKPDDVKSSHKLICGDSVAAVTDNCGVYNPRVLWMIGVNILTSRKIRTQNTRPWTQEGGTAPKTTFKTMALRLKSTFLEGLKDTGYPSNCTANGRAINSKTKNECPDAFDVLGRLCECNCTKDGVDNDSDGVPDEECELGEDNDGDGVATVASNCE